MARIVAGVGSSQRKFDEPDWKPLFDGYAPVKRWLHEAVKP